MDSDYNESVEESIQIARSALPLASGYQLPANPITYAVFYEYVAGLNPGLCQALDQMRETPERLTAENIQSLYHTFINMDDEQMLQKVHQALVKISEATQDSIDRVGQEAKVFQSGLNSGVQRLKDAGGAIDLVEVVSGLVDEATRMQSVSRALSEELEKTNGELDSLRTDFQRVRHESLIDPLTGAQNRRAFDTKIEELCTSSMSDGKSLSLLMVDIDHFKKVNDTYGHVTGDVVIKWVAKMIQEAVRGADILARYGGEEFVLLLPDTSMEGAERVADNVCNKIRNNKVNSRSLTRDIGRITVSVGVAEYMASEEAEKFVSRSDEALYRAKQSGRNRVCTHS